MLTYTVSVGTREEIVVKEEDALINSLRGLLVEALKIRKLPKNKRRELVNELAESIDWHAELLEEKREEVTNLVILIIWQQFQQAVTFTPERPQEYRQFLEIKNRLATLIPEDLMPRPMKAGVYEIIGAIILGEEVDEPTF